MTTTLVLVPADKLNAYINFDYGRKTSPTGVASTWKGVAEAAKCQLNDRFALTLRLEWCDDTSRFPTGNAKSVKEFTFTAGAKAAQGVLARLEYGHDCPDKAFFQKGPTALVKNQHRGTGRILWTEEVEQWKRN
jgi:putative OmpL-like beta-barrel porin-2